MSSRKNQLLYFRIFTNYNCKKFTPTNCKKILFVNFDFTRKKIKIKKVFFFQKIWKRFGIRSWFAWIQFIWGQNDFPNIIQKRPLWLILYKNTTIPFMINTCILPKIISTLEITVLNKRYLLLRIRYKCMVICFDYYLLASFT